MAFRFIIKSNSFAFYATKVKFISDRFVIDDALHAELMHVINIKVSVVALIIGCIKFNNCARSSISTVSRILDYMKSKLIRQSTAL